MTLFSEYDPKRDRAHADYDPSKDIRVPIFNPLNDPNLYGKGTVTIDPKRFVTLLMILMMMVLLIMIQQRLAKEQFMALVILKMFKILFKIK